MWSVLHGLLWLVSFVTFPFHANGFWAPKEAAWLVGSFVLASGIWWNAPTQAGLRNRPLGWWCCWVMLSFGYFVLWPQLTTPQTMETPVRLRWYVSPILPTMTWIGSLLAYESLVRHTDSLARWHRVALHLVWIGCLVALWAIAQRLNLDPFETSRRSVSPLDLAQRPLTMLGNSTLTGTWLAICAPLAAMFRPRRYQLGAVSLMVVAIGLSNSASSLVAVWLALVATYGLQRRWRASLVTLGLGLLVGGWLWQTDALQTFCNPSGRWEIWRTAGARWLTHPFNTWVGFGAGSVGAFTAHGVWPYGFLHNDLLQLFFEFGLIGGGLALGALWTALRPMRQIRWDGASAAWGGSAIAYGLLSLVGFPLQIGSMLMLGMLILAALSAHAAQTQEG